MAPSTFKLRNPIYKWMEMVCGTVCPTDLANLPRHCGKCIQLATCVDTNFYHCMLSGRAVTGILHFANNTPIDWFSKKQSTVETATRGSKFVAACIAMGHTINLCPTFKHLGIPVHDVTYMFGDDKSVF